jgi:hypothetical protein
MKKARVADTLRFPWTCPVCLWSGEISIQTHFGNDQGRHLRVGDCLFDCHKKVEPRHLHFLELFPCPGCSSEDGPFYYVAEIHCLGNTWTAVRSFPAHELEPVEARV